MTLNLADIIEAVATAVPDRAAIIHRGQTQTYAALHDRTRRFANFLLAKGFGLNDERPALKNWELGQDHIGIFMLNSPEFVESMLGCFKARATPFTINYRYVRDELLYLFNDAQPSALIYQAQFTDIIADLAPEFPSIRLLIQVDDGSGIALLPGAISYEDAIAEGASARPNVTWSSDDIYMTYTGGTTGMPKGVLWRQEDCIAANLGGRTADGAPIPDVAAFVARAETSGGYVALPAPPMMHGAGCHASFAALLGGNTIAIQSKPERMDPDDLLATVAETRANMLLIIGDAFGKPLLEAARKGAHDISSLRFLYNTGAILSADVKAGLLALNPKMRVVDALGSSETGPQAISVTSAGNADADAGPQFKITDDSAIVSEDRSQILATDDTSIGWLARTGSVPLGYLGDQTRTEATFPVINGVRYVIGGDRVQRTGGGGIQLLGRESFTINSGGEKIFAEEVEQALKRHPDVVDVTVAGRPSPRWGQEVVALVQVRADATGDRQSLLEEAARHIARYKLPKAFLFVDTVQRGASAKTDMQWARTLVGDAT